MARTLRFRWPQLNQSLHVDLLDEYNRGLATALWEAAPLMSIQSHAIVAGEQIYFPTRLRLTDPERAYQEPMHEQPAGRVNFEPYFQYVALNYGPMTEPVPAWPLGQVVADDLGVLPTLGRQVWDHFWAGSGNLLVVVERAETAPLTVEAAHLAAHRGPVEVATLSWVDVLAHLERETDAIWINEPEDVRALRLGVQTSEAGVYGQYFSPWVMIAGLIRSLAIVELSTLVRLCRNPLFSLPQLQTLLREMLGVILGVVSFFGLPQLGATLAAVERCAAEIDQHEDFTCVVDALFTYVNRYNLWLYQTFPWRLGTFFPKPSFADARARLELSGHAPYQPLK